MEVEYKLATPFYKPLKVVNIFFVSEIAIHPPPHIVMDSIVVEEPYSSSTISDGGGGGGGGGGRAIDRHNPIIRDEKRLAQGRIFPSTSTITITSTAIPTDPHHHHDKLPSEVEDGHDQKRKSVAFANDDEFMKSSDFISPASSSRCLLSHDKAKTNFSPPREPLNSNNGNACYDDLLLSSRPLVPQPPLSLLPYDGDDGSLLSSPPKPPPSPPREHLKCHNYSKVFSEKHHDSLAPKPKPSSPSPPSPPSSSDKEVVLDVSLHCRGCERKMKKHISKIEGVTSFKIDFAAKKVTVVGDVTPLAVLTSVLKVKNAKLLTPATISSSQTGSSLQQS